MATDLGKGVSTVYDDNGYNYDMVVFQKGKPPLDAELNLAQELQNLIANRNMRSLPSGWLSLYPLYADRSLGTQYPNKFFTQNPSGAKPEFALVNGQVLYVTNTNDSADNANLINLGTPPSSGNVVNGVFLEMWRALLDPNTNLTNGVPVKPDPATVVDTFNGIYMIDSKNGWVCGENGLILKTTTGGSSWAVMSIDTKRNLNSIHFFNSTVGWVVGDNGVIGRSSSGGQTWTMLTSPTVINLNSVFATSQNTVWAVGDNGVLLKAANGVSFVPVTSGVTNNLNEVYFCDAQHGWIVGDNGIVLTTTNGGSSWTQASSGTTNNLNGVCFYNKLFGFAVGDNGTILYSANGGASWTPQISSTSKNLYDVTMYPQLDVYVDPAEEVSSQLGDTGITFTVAHKPITGVDRKGNVTYNPTDVKVLVNGNPVTVTGVNGVTGQVVLATPPGPGAVTKINYYYQSSCAVFQGKAWTVGASGTVLYTGDIGATWTAQDPNLTVVTDLRSVSFVSQEVGWLCGMLSNIRNTADHGANWSIQQSDVFSRKVQRVWQEGNTESAIYLDENTIHPDALIETTKRVQVQYRIRVIDAIDPLSHPEAGLSSSVTGRGPNAAGATGFPYENMGPINGDYGCWRAKCNNTVDGYCYAIPMFMVNRRNTQLYSVANQNGQHGLNTPNIRPDLLLATNVVPADILDARRKIIIPSTEEIFYKGFDALSANNLKTNFVRVSSGGDQFGSELLAVDPIDAAVASAGVSSESTVVSIPALESAVTLPISTAFDPSPYTGIFHPDPGHYSARYDGTGAVIPGVFTGLGTKEASFIYNTNTQIYPYASNYIFSADFIKQGATVLKHAPTDPQLTLSDSTVYHGVLENSSGKIIESWGSGLSGYPNYAMAYPAQDYSSTSQVRASSVEAHYFIQTDTSNLSGGSLIIPRALVADVDSSAIPYNIFTVRQVYNRTSGFAHRISNIDFNTLPNKILITPVAGYEFVLGVILEITAAVTSNGSNTNIRNGAAVNLNSRTRGINSFTRSEIAYASSPSYSIVYPSTSEILGWSATDSNAGLNHAVGWAQSGMFPTDVSRSGGYMNQIRLLPTVPLTLDATIQLLIKDTALPSGNLKVGYSYTPYQSQGLPPSLTIEPVQGPLNVYVSNLGAGAGNDGEPHEYNLALEHLPVNSDLVDDKIFSNTIQMQMANSFISGGFIQIPVTVPGALGGSLVLSTPLLDKQNRSFYSACSKELKFAVEGLQVPVPRKVYLPLIARVKEGNSIFMGGEYIMVVFSRPVILDKENVTGYFASGNCSIAVYRFPNRPISRV